MEVTIPLLLDLTRAAPPAGPPRASATWFAGKAHPCWARPCPASSFPTCPTEA